MNTRAGAQSSKWIAIIGDRVDGFEPQDSISSAIRDSARILGVTAPDVRWIGTETIEAEGATVLATSSAVWCAPGSPYRSLDGALAGIRWAREFRLPFLGTCAGFQHGVIEFARNVVGRVSAAHAEYGPSADSDLFIEELLCSLVGLTMEVEVVDAALSELYGTRHPRERYYCRFGLNPDWRSPLEAAGMIVGGVDAKDGDVRILRIADHPFFILTLFVPQTSSSPGNAHPLITAFVRAALSSPPSPGSESGIGPTRPDFATQVRRRDLSSCAPRLD